jgi:hypothetical protein
MDRIVAFSEVTIRLGLMVGMVIESDIGVSKCRVIEKPTSAIAGEKWVPLQ